MRRWYHVLPGPAAVRIAVMVVVTAAVVVAVVLLYEWVGSTFFDSGGTLG